MFRTRLISGIVLVVILIAVMMAGGAVVLAVSLAISLIGMFEYYRAVGIEKSAPGIAGYLMCLVFYGMTALGRNDMAELVIIGAFMLIMACYVFRFPAYSIEQIAEAFVGVIYPGAMMSYIYRVRVSPDGQYLVWLIFLSSWGCDTLAYCAGRLFGRHKMTPVLSPHKTVEGGIGGVVGAAVLGWLFAVFTGPYLGLSSAAFRCTVTCAVGALISMVGDLAASGIKRNHSIKDYGTLIPGHGGIMDRFDSVIFTAPAIYFALMLLGH